MHFIEVEAREGASRRWPPPGTEAGGHGAPRRYVVTRTGAQVFAGDDAPTSAIAALHRHAERAEAYEQEAGWDRRRAA